MEKCITISLIFCMLLALASCGKTDTSSPENSISIDTENVDELVKMAHVSMTRDEYRELLGLRIAQDLCVCIKQSTKLYHLHASSRH